MAESKRTKALKIPKEVKRAVYERDNHRCLVCNKYVDVSNACCHFIARSQGGLGIESNILTLCDTHHREYDNGFHREAYKEFFTNYLKEKYPDWNEKDLVYDKWRGVFDDRNN